MVGRMQQRYKLTISGQVQGVGYRRWFQQQAIQLQVCGWVRNLPTGQVEALVITTPTQLQRLIELAYIGPNLAQVIEVSTVSDEGGIGFQDFQIIK